MSEEKTKHESRNVSFLFMPFCLDSYENFHQIVKQVDTSEDWKEAKNRPRYLLRYITEKLEPEREDCCCYHYILNDAVREIAGLPNRRESVRVVDRNHILVKNTAPVQLGDLHLYLFATSVGILAWEMEFQSDDPLVISTTQFRLKNVNWKQIKQEKNAEEFSMLEAGKDLMTRIRYPGELQWFFYQNLGNERANFLTYLEMPMDADYKWALYYLRHCYSANYIYRKDSEDVCFSLSEDLVWGISSEAAVCIGRTGLGSEQFLEHVFFKNFKDEYLFTMILMLHQKYALNQMLSELGVGAQNDLNRLEEYHSRLYEFETNYSFGIMTEVPQYQILCEQLTKAFGLEKLFDDVYEPVTHLLEIRNREEQLQWEKADKKRQEQDARMNRALGLLSFLTIFSAIVDGWDILTNYLPLSGLTLCLWRSLLLAVVLGIAGFVIWNIITKDK